MAGPLRVALRGVQQCKIAKLLTDGTVGGTPTYDSILDVPIVGLSFKPTIETYTLKHNDAEQEIDQQTQSWELTGSMGRVPLDVLAVMEGGTVVPTGSNDAEIQTYTNNSADIPKYFKLETQTTRVFAQDGTAGDAHFVFPKCKLMDINYTIDEGFATLEFTAKAIRTVCNGNARQTVFNETKTDIT